jgi:hypothetical protein
MNQVLVTDGTGVVVRCCLAKLIEEGDRVRASSEWAGQPNLDFERRG